ncbi:unnamed protein product, partial [Arctogadus glacialis]
WLVPLGALWWMWQRRWFLDHLIHRVYSHTVYSHTVYSSRVYCHTVYSHTV